MQTISINLIEPQGWHELDDKQLRYVYSLIAEVIPSLGWPDAIPASPVRLETYIVVGNLYQGFLGSM